MSWKKATPGRGGKPRAEHFTYTPTAHGTKNCWAGWMAGDVYWCEVHEHKPHAPGTKVCLDWFTDGELVCPRCRPAVIPTVVAYVPIYREQDHKACVVICHETAADMLKGLRFGVRVLVGRVDEGASVFVRRTDDQSPFVSSIETRKSPCDLSTSLLTMWGYPQLQQWIANAIRKRKTEANEGKDPGTMSNGQPFGPLYRAAAARYTSVPEAVSSEDATAEAEREILRRAQKASTNGKHKTSE